MSHSKERTLAIIKPNAIKNAGQIITRYESKGLHIIAGKYTHLTAYSAQQFYAEHKGKGFFNNLVSFMSSKPVWILVLEGTNAVMLHREIMGATDPAKALPGTIRKDFGASIDENAVHGSDSITSAAREISYFFSETEIHSEY